jgi:hypothetical protein
MKNEDNVDDLLDKLNKLRIEESNIIEKIIKARNENNDKDNNIARREGDFKIGDKVQIINPRRYQESIGIICKITETRVTIKPRTGIKIIRSHKNVKLITDDE